jgi:hypothetical protein
MIGLGLVGLTLLVASAAHGAGTNVRATSDAEALEAGFKLNGTHGYSIAVAAYSVGESQNRGAIHITVSRRGELVNYTAPATVTATALHAELGALGRVNVVRNPSGRTKRVRPKCLGGQALSYEPAVYEGVIEFKGERGYTTAIESRTAAIPTWLLFTNGDFCGSGSGETTGPGTPGARLRGVSFAHDRNLSFQVNKNKPGAKAVFTASLKERRGGIWIDRALAGSASSRAFRFDPNLRTATLSPPSPFSGSASLRRSEDSPSPLLTGNLKLSFPGRAPIQIAGPSVHVSIVHAHFTRSNGPHAEIGFGPTARSETLSGA